MSNCGFQSGTGFSNNSFVSAITAAASASNRCAISLPFLKNCVTPASSSSTGKSSISGIAPNASANSSSGALCGRLTAGSPTSSNGSFLSSFAHRNDCSAASNSTIASGSNTNTNIIITHRTACSSKLASGLSPYINAAIYLTGPIWLSAMRLVVATGARSACMETIFFCASAISACNCLRSDN